jgi:phosphoribosylanthranilate isomerase
MRNKENNAQLIELPIDYIGFIFYDKSPRFVGTQIDPAIIELIPPQIQKVGVFVNSPLNETISIAENNQIDFLQLHGSETPEYCNKLQDRGFSIIKSFKAENEGLQKKLEEYRFSCNYYLFDTPTKNFGGSGEKFDWTILKSMKIYLPFFQSRGNSLEDAKSLQNIKLQGHHAIDLNSRFETSPGIKNIELIRNFIEHFKND